MRIAFIGNFSVPWSTESHVSASMEILGHEVVRLQENEVGWVDRIAATESCDLAWWCSTYDYAHRWDQADAHAAVDKLNAMLPFVYHHLDLFFGLSRARQVRTEPWARCRWVFTADGDHDEDWVRAGVNHHFLPPAVFGPECVPGRYRPSLASDVAFVGSWQGYGHPEHWPARKAMLDHLRAIYGDRFKCWPTKGQPAVRGQALNDLYASARVVVGDSCLASTSRGYVSDRLFEQVGRGAATVFPWIERPSAMVWQGTHCRYFPPGDHAEMVRQIDWLLDNEDERHAMVKRGMAHVRAEHTYAHRVQTIFDTVL